MISSYLSLEITGEPFSLFSSSHIVALSLLAIAALTLFLFRTKLKQTAPNRIFRYTLAGLLLLTEFAFQVWHLYTNSWSAAYTLPLQLCSVSLLLCIVMLLANSYRLYEITYFWGLGGALQAMITPELFYPFPHFRFLHFFLAHAAIILACLFMTWVEGYRPTVRSLWKSIGFLNLLLPVAFVTNIITGGNYLFVSHKPVNPSLLDYLGPYPWYILSLEGVALLLFTLLYLPFRRRQSKKESPFAGDVPY
ncbi:TIGR02206 family membrane protein [Brevibacillus ruminantium]|uniref:TIGR02206 family membrane protein n=1 Tax=Brevibacillus ruminantium TaxID=2950604 RepID=A0ABY4WQN7_9BACL|nr:TIGR02206 family membrane protein [Brevibacillus ruminantium]USG68185.1 TIGR02206 family membrane protein [Brevibacillus ruminantium]